MKKVKVKNFNERIERVANACMDEILVLLNNETPNNYFNFGKVLISENLPTVTWLYWDYPNHIEQVNISAIRVTKDKDWIEYQTDYSEEWRCDFGEDNKLDIINLYYILVNCLNYEKVIGD